MKKNLLLFTFMLLCGFQYINGQNINGQIIKQINVTCKKIGENGKIVQDDRVCDFLFYIKEINGNKYFYVYNKTADNYYFIDDSKIKKWSWIRNEREGNSLICSVGFWGYTKEFNEILKGHFQYQYEIYGTVIIHRVLFMFEPTDINKTNNIYTAYQITSNNGEEFDKFIWYLRDNLFEEIK